MRNKLQIPAPLDGRLWLHRAQAPGPRSTHTHDELEFNLVTSGRAAYLVRETRQELRAGTLIWLFPDHEHLLVDQSPDFAMWILVIRPRPLRAACTTARTRPLLETNPTGPICRILQPDQAVALERLCAQVLDDEDEPARYNAGLAYAVLCAWRAFDDAERAVRATGVHPAVERAARILRDDDPSLDLPALARRCGLSADRLGRLFRRQTGVSLTDYRNRARVDHFMHHYGRGERLNMTAAALAAGFGSYAQFHRVFKNVMNCSPAAYRRQVRP